MCNYLDLQLIIVFYLLIVVIGLILLEECIINKCNNINRPINRPTKK